VREAQAVRAAELGEVSAAEDEPSPVRGEEYTVLSWAGSDGWAPDKSVLRKAFR
jgi:hypothetical protein